MKYLPIPSALFIENRKRLISKMKPNSIAIFNSNDIMPTNADGNMLFRQNNDLFYFSGIDQEETILLLFPDAPKAEWREILFVRETSELIAVWEGHKLSKEEARAASGIETVCWLSDFENLLLSTVFEATTIYLNTNEHVRSSSPVQTRDARFVEKIKATFPLHGLERIAPLINQLRAIKSSIEIELISQAIAITDKAFRRALKFIQPGVAEYQIEAEITHEFLWNRATRHAYTPIIASGANACILHYNDNNRPLKDGDLVLMDFGAEYANYAADLTRTVPVNGKFSPRQKEVYMAVLAIQKYAKSILKPGINFEKYNLEIGKKVEEELIKLKLLTTDQVATQSPKNPLYRTYFMHGTSHFLGLDVHDVGSRFVAFSEGMVLTCEPGIYIKEEGIGIRLENNLVLSSNSSIDLMQNIPIEVAEIEALMKTN